MLSIVKSLWAKDCNNKDLLWRAKLWVSGTIRTVTYCTSQTLKIYSTQSQRSFQNQEPSQLLNPSSKPDSSTNILHTSTLPVFPSPKTTSLLTATQSLPRRPALQPPLSQLVLSKTKSKGIRLLFWVKNYLPLLISICSTEDSFLCADQFMGRTLGNQWKWTYFLMTCMRPKDISM